MQAYDQVRSRYSEGSSDVTPAERDQILETYPGDSRMGEFVAEANRAYASALARVGQSSGEPEPVSAIYQEAGVGVFPDDIAAGQLFVSPDELRSAIAQLTPELLAVGPEEDSWLSSREYRQGYLRLLCGLQRQAQNVPVGCP
jgi:hypothetical protein